MVTDAPTEGARLSFAQVLRDEYELLRPVEAESLHDDDLTELYRAIHTGARPLSALCLSGGGVRSASFALGIIQGLARRKVLGKLDYLSTVSGGGYIGSCLTAWMSHSQICIDEVQKVLAGEERQPGQSPLDPESEAMRYLRAHSSYLSPGIGLLSADTWTLIAIYLRNLLANWLVIVPLAFAVVLVPRLFLELVRWPLDDTQGRHTFARVAAPSVAIAGLLCAGLAIRGLHSARDTSNTPATSPQDAAERAGDGTGQGVFVRRCLIPAILAILLIVFSWPLYVSLHRDGTDWWRAASVGAGFGFAAGALGLVLRRSGWKNALPWFAAASGFGACAGFLMGLVAIRLFPQPDRHLELYACLSILIIVALVLLVGATFTALASRGTRSADSEWYGRAGAWLLMVAVAWTALCVLVIYGPLALVKYAPLALASISLGSAASLFTLTAGFSPRTSATPDAATQRSQHPSALDLALKILAPLVVVFLVVMLSLLVARSLAAIRDHLPAEPAARGAVGYRSDLKETKLLPFVAGALAGAASFGILMGWFIDINRLSMQALYGTRLVRAYLGASRTERNPNRFTGFDNDDDLPMHGVGEQRPLQVCNMALNLVRSGRYPAWRERKAESFTMTGLHAGNHRLGYRSMSVYGATHSRWRAGSTPTDGLRLGTAMAISGAAISPNMGAHSSPVVTFLLAIFNLRLGSWLGNPGEAGDCEERFRRAGPRFSVAPLIKESFGLTDDAHGYVYLSDGGHFENLGLYEMVLRRCRPIIVADASADPDYKFGDLANAIRKIRIDLGIPITVDEIAIYPPVPKRQGIYCAICTVDYPAIDGEDAKPGMLVYIKPVIYGTEPIDVRTFGTVDAGFPNDSTGNQWFTESQFESYRALGEHIVDTICGDRPGAFDDVEQFAVCAASYVHKHSAA